MATRSECFACGDPAGPRERRFSLRLLLNIVAVVAVASALMYAEIWAIQQGPVLSDSYILESTGGASSGTDTALRDTAGPVAVLH